MTFTAKVVPGSSRTAVSGILGGMLKVKVAAAAEKGKANKGLIDYLAEKVGVRKNCVQIISGLTGPIKQIHIGGISAKMLFERLALSKQD